MTGRDSLENVLMRRHNAIDDPYAWAEAADGPMTGGVCVTLIKGRTPEEVLSILG